MYLLPHINHVCYTDATAINSWFLTYYNIAYFHDTTAILVDYPQWDKCTFKTHSFLGYEGQALVSFTVKFPHHLPNYSHQNGGHNTELNEKVGHEKGLYANNIASFNTQYNVSYFTSNTLTFIYALNTHVDTHV